MTIVTSQEYRERLLAAFQYLGNSDLIQSIRSRLGPSGDTTEFYPVGTVQIPECPLYLGLKVIDEPSKKIPRELQLFEFLYALGLPVPYISLVVTNGNLKGILTEDFTQGGKLDLTVVAGDYNIPRTLENDEELRQQFVGYNGTLHDTGFDTFGKAFFVAHREDKTGMGGGVLS